MAVEKVESIDLTPTWEGLTPWLIAILRGGETVEAQKTAEQELSRMAGLADRYVDAVKRTGGVMALEALLQTQPVVE